MGDWMEHLAMAASVLALAYCTWVLYDIKRTHRKMRASWVAWWVSKGSPEEFADLFTDQEKQAGGRAKANGPVRRE